MPSTAFGPLIEPGWPNLPQNDLGTKFINAFAIGSEINRRKRQLENQMAAMVLREQQNNITNSIREAEFERKLDQGNQRLAIAQQGADLRGMMDQIRLDTMEGKLDQAQRTAQDVSDGTREFLQSGAYNPADPESVATRLSILRLYPGMKSVGWTTDKVLNEHNAALKAVDTNLRAERGVFVKHVASDVFKDKNLDAGALLSSPELSFPGFETEQTPDEKKLGIPAPVLPNIDPATGKLVRTIKDSRGQTRTFKFTPDGNYVDARSRVFRLAPLPGSTDTRYSAPIPEKQYADLAGKLRKMDEGIDSVPAQSQTPSVGRTRVFNKENFDLLQPGEKYYFIRSDGKRIEGVK